MPARHRQRADVIMMAMRNRNCIHLHIPRLAEQRQSFAPFAFHRLSLVIFQRGEVPDGFAELLGAQDAPQPRDPQLLPNPLVALRSFEPAADEEYRLGKGDDILIFGAGPVGLSFCRFAKLLGLGYPGGPALAALAATGRPGRYKLPRPMVNSGDLSFSFSGLKTAVLTLARAQELTDVDKADLAAEFQEAVTEVLALKAVAACRQHRLSALVVAGGVGANQRLRQRLDQAMAVIGGRVFYPALELCTDNGAMIAFCGAQRLLQGEAPVSAGGAFVVRPRWPLAQLS